MDKSFIFDVKNKPEDQGLLSGSAHSPSRDHVGFLINKQYQKDVRKLYYISREYLDEMDGQFKCREDLLSNHIIPPSLGDFKNHCYKCKIQFNTLLAAQNHYIFTHPDSSMLTKSGLFKNTIEKRRSYNWLDEPIKSKIFPIQKKYSYTVLNGIKKKGDHLKYILKIPDKVLLQGKGYTLENIKAKSPNGIKVVKKSDIEFDRLRTQVNLKLLSYTNNPEAQLRQRKLENQSLKYVCRKCSVVLLNPLAYDMHMRLHNVLQNLRKSV